MRRPQTQVGAGLSTAEIACTGQQATAPHSCTAQRHGSWSLERVTLVMLHRQVCGCLLCQQAESMDRRIRRRTLSPCAVGGGADPHFLSPEEMEERIRAIFQDADKDGNGVLDRKEFKSVRGGRWGRPMSGRAGPKTAPAHAHPRPCR